MGVPLYSARGLKQTIVPVQESKPTPRYTINGDLRWLGLSQLRKYETVITCTDQNAPAFAGLWPGMIVTVDCVVEWSYATAGGSPERTVVSGSERVTDDGFTYYRPRLECMVTDFNLENEEYQHDYIWQLSLKER